ncbi:MAG: hypothetical protein M3P18_01850 [Actinomycetota bacterium]|nr:hypothetical protein [Actinomycetota bacterium]
MPSVKPYLDPLDATPAPDLWSAIAERSPLLEEQTWTRAHLSGTPSPRRRFVAAIVAIVVAIAGFAFAERALNGSTGPTLHSPLSPMSEFDSPRVPWTLDVPTGWHVDADRTRPDSNAKTGLLATWAVNSTAHVSFEAPPTGPNSEPGATKVFGSDGAIVLVELLYPPGTPIEWDPRPAPTKQSAFTPWFNDAQNPGWVFRWRRQCVRSGCLQVIEWHGPQATTTDLDQLGSLSSSLSLRSQWADPKVAPAP